jgi:hypothetical protein
MDVVAVADGLADIGRGKHHLARAHVEIDHIESASVTA